MIYIKTKELKVIIRKEYKEDIPIDNASILRGKLCSLSPGVAMTAVTKEISPSMRVEREYSIDAKDPSSTTPFVGTAVSCAVVL